MNAPEYVHATVNYGNAIIVIILHFQVILVLVWQRKCCIYTSFQWSWKHHNGAAQGEQRRGGGQGKKEKDRRGGEGRKQQKQHLQQLSHETFRFVEDLVEVRWSVTHLWLEQNQKMLISTLLIIIALLHFTLSEWRKNRKWKPIMKGCKVRSQSEYYRVPVFIWAADCCCKEWNVVSVFMH